MLITGNQLLSELRSAPGKNYATLVLLSGSVPDFDAANSACRADVNGGYVYVGQDVKAYLTGVGSIAASVSGFAPTSVVVGEFSVNPEQRNFACQVAADVTPTWAVLFASHAATSDFLNTSLTASVAIFMTVGASGTEDIAIGAGGLPSGSLVYFSGLSLSSSLIVD